MSIYLKQFYFTQYIIEIIDVINDINCQLEKEELDIKDIKTLQNVKANFLKDVGIHIVEQWSYE